MSDFLAELARHYTIPDPEGVQKFLETHKDLLPALQDAPAEIRKVFPESHATGVITQERVVK